ncbi:MAG: HEAT repeat domain-containing protein [bacterium]
MYDAAHSAQAGGKDFLTGLPTTHGWVSSLNNGLIPVAGAVIALNISGIININKQYGREAADKALREASVRIQGSLPREAILLRGNGTAFFAWIPGLTTMLAQAMVTHLKQTITGTSVKLSNATAAISCAGINVSAEFNAKAQDVFTLAERELSRQPEYEIGEIQKSDSATSRLELENRLVSMQLYGQDWMIEQALSRLKLPVMSPQSVLVVGAAPTGKARMLSSLKKLLAGQNLPLAEVECKQDEQAIPYSLLTSLIMQFLSFFPAEQIRTQTLQIIQIYPWLCGIFTILQTPGGIHEVPSPPEDLQNLQNGLETVLAGLVKTLPNAAIIHNLHTADSHSLNTLIQLQRTAGHGLRIIASVDADGRDLPAKLQPLSRGGEALLILQPLTERQVLAYLEEALPDIAIKEAAKILYEESEGMPLNIESTLRLWADTGMICYVGDRWEFHPEKIQKSATAALHPVEAERLGKAALAGAVRISFLATLWKTDIEDARATVNRGRNAGILKQIDHKNPDMVDFIDGDHAAAVAKTLTRELRIETHAEIALLIEKNNSDNRAEISPTLAYHFEQAGLTEKAEAYTKMVQYALPQYLPDIVSQEALQIGGAETWNIPAADPLSEDDLPRITEAVSMIRLAGVQFKLYPPSSEITRLAVRDAITALDKLLANRPSLVLTFDGRTLGIDGQILMRRELQAAARDIQNWMSDGNIRAIGIARGVRDYELSRFLHVIANIDRNESATAFLTKISSLNLVNIKVLTRSVQADLLVPGLAPGLINALSNIPNFNAQGGSLEDAFNQASPGNKNNSRETMPRSGKTWANRNLDIMPNDADRIIKDVDPNSVPTLSRPENISPELWPRLPEMIAAASAHVRRIVMNNLAKWLDELGVVSTKNLPDGLDHLIIDRLQKERDSHVLSEVLACVEQRLVSMLTFRNWTGIYQFIEPMAHRINIETLPDVMRQLTVVLDRISETVTRQGLIDDTPNKNEDKEIIRNIVSLLGMRVMKMLVVTLKTSPTMQERARVLQLLREFGDNHLPMLLHELRDPNPWYVYRNILQVLAEIGTEDMLGLISDKIRNNDPRVRSEAITTAVKIAKGNAVPYLIQGLEDDDLSVRTRAASLAASAPHPRIQEVLLRILQGKGKRDEPNGVLMPAVMALGAFDNPVAIDALIQIVKNSVFSPYGRKSDEVRASAISALASHIDLPEVLSIIKQSVNDRHPLIKANSQRALMEKLNQ